MKTYLNDIYVGGDGKRRFVERNICIAEDVDRCRDAVVAQLAESGAIGKKTELLIITRQKP